MQIKFKALLLGLSLSLNGFFILLVFLSAFSKSSSLSFFKQDGYITAAAVVSVPESQSASVELITVNIRPHDKAYLQFSVVSNQNKQGNLLFNPLYDPFVISIAQTGFGMEITALREGSALIQTLTNDGIKNVAQVFVSE